MDSQKEFLEEKSIQTTLPKMAHFNSFFSLNDLASLVVIVLFAFAGLPLVRSKYGVLHFCFVESSLDFIVLLPIVVYILLRPECGIANYWVPTGLRLARSY